ncbi:Reverse transcriptase domain [Trinorchestia longiramus]|nr:Reverse transcriptase domain [Trinorchestia longiramus]
MHTNSVQQHINEPTRGNNITDLVMTTNDLSINGLDVTDKIGDHQMIDFSLETTISLERESGQPITLLGSHKRLNASSMQENIRTEDSNDNKQNRIVKNISTPAGLLSKRKNLQNEIKIIHLQLKSNPKSFYICVNDRRLKRDSTGPLIDSEGSMQTNNISKAKILNTYFTSVFTHEDSTEIPQPHALNTQEILSDGVFTVVEVKEELSILNPYKSTGPDGLGPRMFKETAQAISKPLTNIFNRSLETSIVPDDWKRGNITPIFKKGNKQIPNNYRPISLTSVISITIERLLKVRITKHLNDYNLINDTQHGFREKRSCLTNLLDFFGEVNRIYDRTKAVDLVYLDFQKAFNKVPHGRLMAKVEAHGIRGNYS